ncbi:MAG: hypothetical protein HY368_00280 [Candidatus Aenigmarchaeota archaeon]|nr:hypothetical protein [Candidatus Aenigmarchaeota archaeon]
MALRLPLIWQENVTFLGWLSIVSLVSDWLFVSFAGGWLLFVSLANDWLVFVSLPEGGGDG